MRGCEIHCDSTSMTQDGEPHHIIPQSFNTPLQKYGPSKTLEEPGDLEHLPHIHTSFFVTIP